MNQELSDYINKAKIAGHSYEQIKNDLLKAGWTVTDIEPFFKNLNEELRKKIEEIKKNGWSTNEQINEDLIKQGYKVDDIQYIFKSLEEKTTSGSSTKLDSYANNPGAKLGDFLLGFFGNIALIWIVSMSGFLSSSPIFIVILFIALMYLAALFSNKGRGFITIGMVSVILVPILAFGACILAFSGGHF